MNASNNDIILLLVAGVVAVVVINAVSNAGSDLIDSGSSAIQQSGQTAGSTVATIAPYALGGGLIWAAVAIFA